MSAVFSRARDRVLFAIYGGFAIAIGYAVVSVLEATIVDRISADDEILGWLLVIVVLSVLLAVVVVVGETISKIAEKREPSRVERRKVIG